MSDDARLDCSDMDEAVDSALRAVIRKLKQDYSAERQRREEAEKVVEYMRGDNDSHLPKLIDMYDATTKETP